MAWLAGFACVLLVLAFLYRRWSSLNEAGLRARDEEGKRLLEEQARLRLEETLARQRAEKKGSDVAEGKEVLGTPGVDDAIDFLRGSFKGDGDAN